MTVSSGAPRARARLSAVALLFVVVAASGARAQAPGEPSAVYPNCNRSCLIGMLHSYLDALSHQDRGLAPFRAMHVTRKTMWRCPLAKDCGVRWVAYRPPALKSRILSRAMRLVRRGAGAWDGCVSRPTGESRERTDHRSRSGGPAPPTHPAPFGDPAKLTHDPAFQEVLPPEQRRERERLIAVANGYFSTVEQNDGQLFTAFDPDCQRNENGISTTRWHPGCRGHLPRLRSPVQTGALPHQQAGPRAALPHCR